MADCETLFEQSLDRFSAQHFPPQRLLVALSGGLDSIVLLHLCHGLFPSRTEALHVNHGYSPLSAEWQAECQRLCDRLGVPLEVRKLPVSGAPLQEAQARRGRYRIFRQQLAADDLLLLAHHQDDQAETILLHMLQGRGAFGMPEARRVGPGWLLRPLLETSRQTLRDYAETHKLQWLEDPSNLDVRHDRNFLRHQIVPQLGKRFPHLPARLAQAAGHMQALQALMVDTLQLDSAELSVALLRGRAEPTRLAILRSWLQAQDLEQPSTVALEAFLTQLEAPLDRQPELPLPAGTIRRYQQRLYFVPAMQVDYQPFSISGVSEIVRSQGTLIVAGGAGVRLPGNFSVKFWQSGGAAEALPRVLQLRGQHHQIAELLRAARVPPWQRDGYPLICDAQGVVCLPGIAWRDGARTLLEGFEFVWQPRQSDPHHRDL